MSRKELPRTGLVAAALAGRITNREGAAALHISARQFQRLKERFREADAPALRHRGRGRRSHRRLPAAITVTVQALLHERYAGFNDMGLLGTRYPQTASIPRQWSRAFLGDTKRGSA